MLESILKNQGLSSRETSVYTLLWEMGELPASVISRRLKMARSGIYLILDKLSALGLVSRICKNGTTFFSAADPAPLLENLRRQKNRELEQLNLLKLDLQISRKSFAGEPVRSAAHYFSGPSGLENLINQMLSDTGAVQRLYLSRNPFTRDSLAGHFEHRGNSHRQAVKILSSEKLNSSPGVLVRNLSPAFDIGIDLIISGDRLALISFPENFGLLIESRLIASAQSKVFDLVWKLTRFPG
jgi:sugar-specific transcriptional regulator TrmB